MFTSRWERRGGGKEFTCCCCGCDLVDDSFSIRSSTRLNNTSIINVIPIYIIVTLEIIIAEDDEDDVEIE